MANKFYPKGAEKVLNGAVNFSTANISVALVASTYTYSYGGGASPPNCG